MGLITGKRKIRLSRKIWQTVEIEVDLEHIHIDAEPETVSDVKDWVLGAGDRYVAYTTVKHLVDEQIDRNADWVDEEREEHHLSDWKWEEAKENFRHDRKS
mgnify:CR=1 FL=1